MRPGASLVAWAVWAMTISGCATQPAMGSPTTPDEPAVPTPAPKAQTTRFCLERSDELAKQLAQYEFLRCQQLATPHVPSAAWFVRNPGNSLVGVLLESTTGVTVLREPTADAEGIIGPDSDATVDLLDLDMDGSQELLLRGLISPSTRGIWVYKWVNDRYIFADSLAGKEVRVERQPEGPLVIVSDKDYTIKGYPLVDSKWRWTSAGFKALE